MNEHRGAARYGLTARVLAIAAAAALASCLAGIFACIALFRGSMSWAGVGSLALTISATMLAPLYLYVDRRIRRPLVRLQRQLETIEHDGEGEVDLAGPRELVELADSLRHVRSRVRACIREPAQLLAGISHDLRTPLARLELRLERIDGAAREGFSRDVACMVQILDEALAYLRCGSQREDFERTDLADLLRSVCTQFVDVGHAVTYDGPPSLDVVCRPSALQRAIGNLLGNALKHGSWAAIRLRPQGHEVVEIAVEDDGPGIPSDLREKVFEPFFRGDTSAEGFGLGLSIARDVIADHGGTIELHERTPRGLIVRLVLPRQR